MRTIGQCWLIALTLASLTTALTGEEPRILNLRGLKPLSVVVAGKTVILVVAGKPPELLRFTNSSPTRIKHPASRKPMDAQVTYGADLIGFANVMVSRVDANQKIVITVQSGGSSQSVTSPRSPGRAAVRVFLAFETEEQAAAVGKVFNLRYAKPSPMRAQTGGN